MINAVAALLVAVALSDLTPLGVPADTDFDPLEIDWRGPVVCLAALSAAADITTRAEVMRIMDAE